MDNKKNLVLGAIKGYSFEQIRPFVVSLKRTPFDGDLVLFCSRVSAETRAALVEQGAKLVSFQYRGSSSWNSFSRFWPMIAPVVRKLHGSPMARKMLRYIAPLQTARFFLYRDFLAAHNSEYGNALLTDVRDVFFQADPFPGFNSELMVFEEDANLRLADDKRNSTLLGSSNFSGPAALDRTWPVSDPLLGHDLGNRRSFAALSGGIREAADSREKHCARRLRSRSSQLSLPIAD